MQVNFFFTCFLLRSTPRSVEAHSEIAETERRVAHLGVLGVGPADRTLICNVHINTAKASPRPAGIWSREAAPSVMAKNICRGIY